MKTCTLLALLFSFFTTTYTLAQTKENQNKLFQATYNQSKVLVQSQDYSFVGDMVYENTIRERLNADTNIISIKKPEVSGTLATVTSEKSSIDVNGKIEDTFEL